MKKIIWILFVMAISAMLASAQEIHLLTKSDGQTATLRWAPTDFDLLSQGWESGYHLSILQMHDERVVLSDTILPWSLGQYKAKGTDGLSPYQRLAASAMYAGEVLGRENPVLDRGQEQQTRLSNTLFAADCDPMAAEALGLRLEWLIPDTSISYSAHITVLGDSGSYSTTSLIKPRELWSQQMLLVSSEEAEGKIHLSWEKAGYTAYFIERSVDRRNWQQLNQHPYVFTPSDDSLYQIDKTYYRDSLPNYQAHYYRVRGLDLFGDLGPYSTPVLAMAVDLTPPQIRPTDATQTWLDNKKVQIYWDMKTSDDIDDIIVKRHAHVDLPREIVKVLEPDVREITEDFSTIHKPMLYYICSRDSAGNENCHAPFMVSKPNHLPPATPTDVVGMVDSAGIMVLTWSKNTEADLWGYIVYMANDSTHDFSRIVGSPIQDNFWADTLQLKTLSEKIYYKVASVDLVGNISALSNTATVVKPDILPPNAPVIKKLSRLGEAVQIRYAPSLSPDVVHHRLSRRSSSRDAWQLVKIIEHLDHHYLDTTVVAGSKYQYQLLAVDDAELTSESVFEPWIKLPSTKLKLGISNVQIRSTEEGSAHVSWEYPFAGKVQFQIYRVSKAADSYTTYRQSREPNIDLTRAGIYRIRAKHSDGHSSAISEPFEIDLQ